MNILIIIFICIILILILIFRRKREQYTGTNCLTNFEGLCNQSLMINGTNTLKKDKNIECCSGLELFNNICFNCVNNICLPIDEELYLGVDSDRNIYIKGLRRYATANQNDYLNVMFYQRYGDSSDPLITSNHYSATAIINGNVDYPFSLFGYSQSDFIVSYWDDPNYAESLVNIETKYIDTIKSNNPNTKFYSISGYKQYGLTINPRLCTPNRIKRVGDGKYYIYNPDGASPENGLRVYYFFVYNDYMSKIHKRYIPLYTMGIIIKKI